VLMAMPSAQGLFHRAVVQSSVQIRVVDADRASEYAERLLSHLGIRHDELHRLQDLPHEQLTAAVAEVARQGGGGAMLILPCIDSTYLPAHPFDPVAAPSGAAVPLLMGTNRHEAALFMARDPRRRRLTESELEERLRPVLGDRLEEIVGAYRRSRPEATPWDLLVAVNTEDRRLFAVQAAERRYEAGHAPTYMYLFTWESDYLGGLFKASHAMEIPFVFDNVDRVPMTGERPDRQQLADTMSRAWVAFARNGNPNYDGLPEWPAYTPERRATMLFDVPSRVDNDPAREERLAWEGMPMHLP
jgi:para-nitrobenzyl esterase